MTKLLLTFVLLFATPASAVQAPTNWAATAYEKFKDPPETRRRAPWIQKEAPQKDKEASSQTPTPPPSPVRKAILGVGAACAVAAVGGSVLADQDSAESSARALVTAFKKPVLVVSPSVETEGATILNEVFNLVKAIVGVGVLSLPAGVAAFGSAPSAVIPACLLITVIGLLSAHGFSLIGRVCAYTGAKSYREAWSRSVGDGTSWIPAWSTTCKTFLACLAFSMVLGDTFSSLLETDRNGTLIFLTVVVLSPLCLMKDLKSLAPFSLLGVLGMGFTALAMTFRYFDGSYAIAEEGTGELVAEVASHLRPRFGNLGAKSVLSPNALILVCMLSTAYMAHFNAPKFYLELKDNTIGRFNTVVSWGFGISIVLMGFISMIGFLTFGKACDGLVLNNYAGSDIWIGLSRLAVAVSLLFSYPLAFTGCRDGVLDLAEIPSQNRSSSLLNLVTVSLMGMITILALSLKDVSFVLAFGGATLGNALAYIFPALMYRAVVRKLGLKGEGLGVFISTMSAVLGVFIGIIGAAMALKSLE